VCVRYIYIGEFCVSVFFALKWLALVCLFYEFLCAVYDKDFGRCSSALLFCFLICFIPPPLPPPARFFPSIVNRSANFFWDSEAFRLSFVAGKSDCWRCSVKLWVLFAAFLHRICFVRAPSLFISTRYLHKFEETVDHGCKPLINFVGT
jgi:hypothetical protein